MSTPFDDLVDDPFADPPSDDDTGSTRLSLDSADYELRWPRQLLMRELTAIGRSSKEQVERLLEDAFLGDTPIQDYHRSTSSPSWSTGASLRFDFLDELLAAGPQLREHQAPSPYWSARHGTAGAPPQRSMAQLRTDFARLITTLVADGYFDRALPKVCVDDHDGVEADPSVVLAERLGVPDLWPLNPDTWDEDTFYDLIEVFHDLAARPRTRRWHSWNQCGWHHTDYATDIGRALYRHRINDLLASGRLELRLAEDGASIGRLVRVVDDNRNELVTRALSAPAAQGGDRVHHAVERFRSRAATSEDKRSAIVVLAGVLEQRLPVIKTSPHLTSKDEADLFNIANNFALRHQDIKQKRDYDPVFLDWMYWWFLAALEVTNHVLARGRPRTTT